MTAKVSARRLKGFQDYQPATMALRYHLMDIVRKEGAQAGFQAIGTPALEYAEVLLGVGGETDKQVFRFRDNGERDVALRFDLTVPFARFVAEHQGNLHFPFKRLQIGDVWRAEKPQKGRYREFCQCDLDIVGVNSVEADIEILGCFLNILHMMDIGPFTMVLGHRVLLSHILQKTLGALNPELEQQALIIIDKLAKIGPAAVTELLQQLPCPTPAGAATLVTLLCAQADESSSLESLEALLVGDHAAEQCLADLRETLAIVSSLAADKRGKIRFDLSIARGLGYYTGLVFETILDQLPSIGSICSGGRYNRLVERYLNRELAGIGGSIGLDRLVMALQEVQSPLLEASKSQVVFVALATKDARAYAFSLVQKLRQAGLAADIALNTQKLSQQFKHADRMAYPFVLTVGSEELEKQTVSCKNMLTGQEDKGLSWEKALTLLQDSLKTL